MSNEFDWDDFEVISEEEEFEGFTVVEDEWEGFSEIKEDLLPQPFYLTQPNQPTEEQPSSAFTNPDVDLSGETIISQPNATLYSQEERDAVAEEEFWKTASFAEKIARADGDRKSNNTKSVDDGMLKTYKSEIDNARASNPKAYEKLSDKETLDALQARGAAELGVDVATLPVAMGKTVLGTISKMAALSTGSEIAGQIAETNHGVEKTEEEKQDEAKRAAAIGAAFGVGGKALEGVGNGLAKAWDKLNGTEALEKLNHLGKKTEDYVKNSNQYSPNTKDTPIKGTISADDVIKTKEGAQELVKLNKHGAKVGTTTLADSAKNPEIQKLLSDAASAPEKLSRAVTGTKGSTFRNKGAEMLGLRKENLKTDRATATKKVSQKVDNDLDDVVDELRKGVRDGDISKSTLDEVRGFSKNLKTARAAGNQGNKDRYAKYINKAEEDLSSIKKGDDFLGEILEQQLVTTKTVGKVGGATNKGGENQYTADIVSSLLGTAFMGADGFQMSDLAAGGAAAFIGRGGRRFVNNKMNKSVDKRSKSVEKALSGKLGDLKSKHKQLQTLKGGMPDGSMLRAYLMMNEE